MAITLVSGQQAKNKRGGSYDTSIVSANFPGSVTSGNLIVVVTRVPNQAVTSVTDTLGTTYTKVVSYNGPSLPYMEIWHGVLASSGTNAVTANFSSSQYVWIHASEWNTSEGTWVLDTSIDTSSTNYDTGGTTDMESGQISTANAVELLVLGCDGALGAATAGSDFTLLDGNIGGLPGELNGAAQYRVTSGTLSSYVAHITMGATDSSTVVLAALKPIASGPTLPVFMHHYFNNA